MDFESTLQAELQNVDKKKSTKTKSTKRVKLAERHSWRCWWCDQKTRRELGWQNSATIEHMVPRSQGGCGEFWNLVSACQRCNFDRQTVDWEDFAIIARTFKTDTRLTEHAQRARLRARRREREQQRLATKNKNTTLTVKDRIDILIMRITAMPWCSFVPA